MAQSWLSLTCGACAVVWSLGCGLAGDPEGVAPREPHTVGERVEESVHLDPVTVAPTDEIPAVPAIEFGDEAVVEAVVVSIPRGVPSCGGFVHETVVLMQMRLVESSIVGNAGAEVLVAELCPLVPAGDERWTSRPPGWDGFWWGDTVRLRLQRIRTTDDVLAGAPVFGARHESLPMFRISGTPETIRRSGAATPADW